MRYRISPLRYAFESVLGLFGHGPRRSHFTPARDPESRMRFAQYLSRVQPGCETVTARRTAARLLGTNGAVSRGIIRHAPLSENPIPDRRPLFQSFTQPTGIAAQRRARAYHQGTPLRTLFHALRAR